MTRLTFYTHADVEIEPGDLLVETTRGRSRQHLVTDVRIINHRVPLPDGYTRKVALMLDMDADDSQVDMPAIVHPFERMPSARRR